MTQVCTVIGASGFVGTPLVSRLRASGLDVYAPAKGDPEIFARDLGVVYDCAGLTADYAARPFDTIEAHVTLVAEIARRARFTRFVYLSSTRLYDAAGLKGPMREDEPLLLKPAEPRHIYDLSKALGENLTMTQMGGRGAVARLSGAFGWTPGSAGFLSQWLMQAARERDLVLESSPFIARDYIHIDDVVDALIAIAAAPDAGIVNLASGELVTNEALAEVFEDAGWRVTFTGQADPPRPPIADISRLRALGCDPRPVLDVVRQHLSQR